MYRENVEYYVFMWISSFPLTVPLAHLPLFLHLFHRTSNQAVLQTVGYEKNNAMMHVSTHASHIFFYQK